jgi:hypothetical protein
MTQTVLILGLLTHWFADFYLQSHEQAMNKWHSVKALTSHILVYSSIWYLVLMGAAVDTKLALLFTIITFASHFITDYFTSKVSHFYFDKKDYHNGFCVVGIDQIFHYLQLFYTAKLLHII